MPTLRVFDPALCCSSGVCGSEVDQALVTFAADVAWLTAHGQVVERLNLAQEPLAFANEPLVRERLERDGDAALPVLLMDGAVRLVGRYPSRRELAEWSGLAYVAPEPKPSSRRLVIVSAESSP